MQIAKRMRYCVRFITMLEKNSWLDIVFSLLLGLPVAIWCGYVASILWGWFLVPSLGIPQIGAVPAAGLIMLLYFMHPPYSKDDDDTPPGWSRMITRAFTALVMLGLAAILNLFM